MPFPKMEQPHSLDFHVESILMLKAEAYLVTTVFPGVLEASESKQRSQKFTRVMSNYET